MLAYPYARRSPAEALWTTLFFVGALSAIYIIIAIIIDEKIMLDVVTIRDGAVMRRDNTAIFPYGGFMYLARHNIFTAYGHLI